MYIYIMDSGLPGLMDGHIMNSVYEAGNVFVRWYAIRSRILFCPGRIFLTHKGLETHGCLFSIVATDARPSVPTVLTKSSLYWTNYTQKYYNHSKTTF